ncbi:MAG: hypothetical protein RR308_15995, partial [Hafnia sp.]
AKEKLFGATFRIDSDTSSVFDKFINEYRETTNFTHLNNSKEDILLTLKAGNIKSLRTLKHVISDINSFYSCLDESHFKNKEALSHTTRLFAALSAEIRSGNLDNKTLKGRSNHGFTYNLILAGSKREPSPEVIQFSEVNKKYESVGVDLGSSIFSDEAIELALIRGLFEKDSFIGPLNKSAFFANPAEVPAWRRMLGFERLDDEATEKAKNELLDQFDTRKIVNPGEMLHLFAFRILMSEIGILDINLETVKKQCIDYINDLFNNKTLQLINKHDNTRLHLIDSYDGQGYWLDDKNRELFIDIFNHLLSKSEELNEIKNEQSSGSILRMMTSDTEKFIRVISHSNLGDSVLADVPILKYIPTNEFVDAFMSTPRRLWRDIKYSLERRYGNHSFSHSLKTEVKWSIELISSFEEKLNTLEGFERYRLQRIIPYEIRKIAINFTEKIESD